MSKEIERIVDELEQAYQGPTWHGPSVKEALKGITAGIAARRMVEKAHTIWELAHHIGAWADIPRRRLLGEKVELTPELNFPPVRETTESAWQRSLEELAERQRKLVDFVRSMDEKRLDETYKDGETVYTVYAVLHGIAQHHVYHAGQIALLKK